MAYQNFSGTVSLFPRPKERVSKTTQRPYWSFSGYQTVECPHCGVETPYWLNGFYSDEEIAELRAIYDVLQRHDLKLKDLFKFSVAVRTERPH